MLYLRSILFVCLLGAMSFGAATPKVEAAQSATVAWDKSPDASVVGYRVLVGTTSGGYTQLTDVQGAAGATVSNLNEGVTYYFAVIAYDAGFTERTSSNEVSYLTPGVPPLPSADTNSKPFAESNRSACGDANAISYIDADSHANSHSEPPANQRPRDLR